MYLVFSIVFGRRRGKPIVAFCRLSDRPIRVRSHVHEPDYVVVQDATIQKEVGIEMDLKTKFCGRTDAPLVIDFVAGLGGREATWVVAIGGDGKTFDIGFGALSGMLERGDDVLYICMDNGAYMNTGGQRAGVHHNRSGRSTVYG